MAGTGGRREGAGRPKGVPNRLNRDIKEMVLGALSDVGGREYLAARAIDTPTAFLTLVGKILPLQLVSEGGSNHLHLHLEAAQRVSAQMLAEPRRVVTIEQEKQDVPSGSLLDAPLPEE